MNKVIENIKKAQELFRSRMQWFKEKGGITEEFYVRLLSMEYHLTNGVQRHFLGVAAHPSMAKKKALRKFLFDFANEEELHYLIAKKDLENMGREPYECTIDIQLWKSYFDSIIQEKPFLRLGGTCILENITAGARDLTRDLLKSAKFLNEKNTRFVVIHQHTEDVPHGDQIIEALTNAKLSDQEMSDLIEGCRISTILFMRMIDWCISGDEIKDLEGQYLPKKVA
jgi:hypothetical protein